MDRADQPMLRMTAPGRKASPTAKVLFSVDWKVIRGSVPWMLAVKHGWTPILEPADRYRFPRPILKIGGFSIPVYTIHWLDRPDTGRHFRRGGRSAFSCGGGRGRGVPSRFRIVRQEHGDRAK